MVIEAAIAACVLFDPLIDNVDVASTVAPSRNVAVPVGAVEVPHPEPLMNACTPKVMPVVIDDGGPKDGRHAMLEVA
jgi:hypothetical protein